MCGRELDTVSTCSTIFVDLRTDSLLFADDAVLIDCSDWDLHRCSGGFLVKSETEMKTCLSDDWVHLSKEGKELRHLIRVLLHLRVF